MQKKIYNYNYPNNGVYQSQFSGDGVVVLPVGVSVWKGNTDGHILFLNKYGTIIPEYHPMTDNQIWYTTLDGKKAENLNILMDPYTEYTLLSNDYIDGLGIATFFGYITTIANGSFYKGQTITSISFPKTITDINPWALSLCSALTDIKWNVESYPTIEYIDAGPLARVREQITSMTFGPSVKNINPYLCRNMTNLTDVIWNSVYCSDFNDSLFSSDTPITSFVFGEEVQHIPARICYGLKSLKSVVIPESVISTGNNAFKGSGLTHIVWNAINCSDWEIYGDAPFEGLESQIETIIFGDKVQRIPVNLCARMTKLSEVTFPKSLSHISTEAFLGCTNLKNITCHAEIPPVMVSSGCLPSTLENIYVPAESIDLYKSATHWSSYSSKIKAIL